MTSCPWKNSLRTQVLPTFIHSRATLPFVTTVQRFWTRVIQHYQQKRTHVFRQCSFGAERAQDKYTLLYTVLTLLQLVVWMHYIAWKCIIFITAFRYCKPMTKGHVHGFVALFRRCEPWPKIQYFVIFYSDKLRPMSSYVGWKQSFRPKFSL